MKNIILKVFAKIALNTAISANDKCFTTTYQEKLPKEFFEFMAKKNDK